MRSRSGSPALTPVASHTSLKTASRASGAVEADGSPSSGLAANASAGSSSGMGVTRTATVYLLQHTLSASPRTYTVGDAASASPEEAAGAQAGEVATRDPRRQLMASASSSPAPLFSPLSSPSDSGAGPGGSLLGSHPRLVSQASGGTGTPAVARPGTALAERHSVSAAPARARLPSDATHGAGTPSSPGVAGLPLGAVLPQQAKLAALRRLALHAVVVDDSDSNRLMLGRLLRGFGIVCDTAENGAVAVAKVQQALVAGAPLHLLTMDKTMPILGGVEATGQIREAGYGGLIIGITGDAGRGDQQDFIRAGADAVLPKPLVKADLVDLLYRQFGPR
jgi:CheY-like chemotaxis protein